MKNNISEADWKVRVDLAAMFRLTNMMGWDDTVWNHITARAPGTDHTFFMHEMGLLYEEVKASNLIKVDEHGKVLEGPEKANTAGFIIHSAIHLNHPDAKFVFHAHPPSALAATALKDGIPHLVQDSSMLYGKVGYHGNQLFHKALNYLVLNEGYHLSMQLQLKLKEDVHERQILHQDDLDE